MNRTSLSSREMMNKDIPGLEVVIDHANNRLRITADKVIPENVGVKYIRFAQESSLGKIIVYCLEENAAGFESSGYVLKGVIKGFFRGRDAYCLTYFIDEVRAVSVYREEEDLIIKMCMEKMVEAQVSLDTKYPVRDAAEEDIPQMVDLFKAVFKTYPSPVFDPEYLKKIMGSRTIFKVAVDNGRIVSIASAEMDRKNLNAEITDCATYPEYRGQGLLSILIAELEEHLKHAGFYTLYSLSRAMNTGINMVLRKHGYTYSGRLINNCDICGRYEDMNIWVKVLKSQA